MNPAAVDAFMAIFGYERVDEVSKLEKLDQWIREHWKLGEDMHFYKWDWLDNPDRTPSCVAVTGATMSLITRGPRKGKPNYRKKKNVQTFYIPIDTYNQIVGDAEA